METREISRLADFLTHSVIEKKCVIILVLMTELRKHKTKREFSIKRNENLTILPVVKLTNACRPGNRSSGSYAEVMRICKSIDRKNGYMNGFP